MEQNIRSRLQCNINVAMLLVVLIFTITGTEAVCSDRDIRLVGSTSPRQGRLEICFNNEWGTVCGDTWTTANAKVACKQLGYTSEGAVGPEVANAYFGQGTGPIHLNGVQCKGSESSITECPSAPPGGQNQCTHAADVGVVCQADTSNCQNGHIRLIGGESNNEGRVEVCFDGRYGTVCDDQWDNTDAAVVCKQLGFSSTDALAISGAYYGEGYGPVLLDDVNCDGSEGNISQCGHRGVGISNCAHDQDASVLCKSFTPSCDNGAVRLVNGRIQSEGRVEYCHNGKWGTVCHDGWGDVDASIVCNQLRYTKSGAKKVTFADFGKGDGHIFLDNVDCTGSEKSLNECSSNGIGYHNCDHSKDAGVICTDPSFSCQNGDVRLSGSTTAGVGRVEVCHDNHYGTVCDDGWGAEEAGVVCAKLGFDRTGAIPVFGAFHGEGVGLVHLDQLNCHGNESNLLDCAGLAVGQSICFHSRDASVICKNSSKAQECLDGAVRLVNGKHAHEGRVEVCYSGHWGGVCTAGWDDNDAAVVCNQLGYQATGSLASTNGFYGRGNGPAFLSDVNCSGSEEEILSCTQQKISGIMCTGEHAGVLCSAIKSQCVDGAIRLADGSHTDQGRVEVCYNGRWGTVNGDGWTSREARVVCRQLGYNLPETRAIALAPGTFGAGEGPTFLNEVRCFGIEESLTLCHRSSNGVSFHTVPSNNAAAVVCSAIPCQHGSVRLTGGALEDQGRLEVCREGTWFAVCGESFTDNHAAQVCSLLDHSQNGAVSVRGLFSVSSRNVESLVFNSTVCSAEDDLQTCLSLLSAASQCAQNNHVGVVCGGGAGQCVNGHTRLVNGANEREGRVEVCLGGEWGTVCDDSWDNMAATVVCKQLGHPFEAATGFGEARFGEGTGSILLSNVKCEGTENSLLKCPSIKTGVCRHREDASVICRDSSPGTEDTPSTSSQDQEVFTLVTKISIPLAAIAGALVILALCITVSLIVVYRWRKFKYEHPNSDEERSSSRRLKSPSGSIPSKDLHIDDV